mgnify:CR=1 FL=1
MIQFELAAPSADFRLEAPPALEVGFDVTAKAGADGYSPSAKVVKTGHTATITITDKDGVTTAAVEDGADGHTPEITAIRSGRTTAIKADGTTIAEIEDGKDGRDGSPGADGAPGAKGDPGVTPDIQIGTVTTLEPGKAATASMSGTAENPLLNLGIPKGAPGETGGGSGSDVSLGLSGASAGQAPVVKTVDGGGKPTAWEAAALARVSGSNMAGLTTEAQDTWRTSIAALPGMKVYGKADANGKIMAYTDAACTQAIDSYIYAMQIREYGNALLIYDHKTYQCVGFEEPASMQGTGNYVVVVFSRTDVRKNAAGATVFTAETARMNIMDYLAGTVDAPITIETYTTTDMSGDM